MLTNGERDQQNSVDGRVYADLQGCLDCIVWEEVILCHKQAHICGQLMGDLL